MEERYTNKGVTICINQRAYEWYILWRCCCYEHRRAYPHLVCPIEVIYKTYYRIAHQFDLIVRPIRPENVLHFLAPYRADQTLSVMMKQPMKESTLSIWDALVPCCVMSAKWAVWYKGVLLQSMQRGCINMALRHVDGRIVTQGKTMRQMANNDNFGFIRSHGLLGSKRISKSGTENCITDVSLTPLLSSTVKQEKQAPVVYDREHDEDEEDKVLAIHEVKDEEFHVSIPDTPGPIRRASGADNERSKVYEYMRKLQAGTPGPSLGAATTYSRPLSVDNLQASGEKLCEDYLSQRNAMEEEFSKNRKELKRKRQTVGSTKAYRHQSPETTVIVSKFIASIHQQLEESTIFTTLNKVTNESPDILEYLHAPSRLSSPHSSMVHGGGKTKKKDNGKKRKKKKKKSKSKSGL